ncbi:MAG: hypothetical protein J5529_04880 [Prevotella sp.]|nr:hypothetical protein [Prevotella sp.]
MKAIKFISTFIILSFFPSLTFAQQLTEKEKKELQIRVMNKIEDFQQYISLIASRKVSSQNKDLAIEKALELFIGKGKDYYLTEIDENTGKETKVHHNAVTIQTVEKKSGLHRPRPMVEYLKELRNKTRYTSLVVESADAFYVDSIIQQLPNGQYEGVAYCYQKYYNYLENRLAYIHPSWKKVKIIFDLKEVPTSNGSKKIWKVWLGDVVINQIT